MFFSMLVHGQKDTVRHYRDSLSIRTSTLLTSYKLPPAGQKSPLPDTKKIKVLNNKNMRIDSSSLKNLKLLPGKDSVNFDLKKTSLAKKDSTDKNKSSKKTKVIYPKGTISVGYDYGFLPYSVNMPAPASAIKTEGLIEADIFNIPVDITYFYSSQKSQIGLNNYFRISYNGERYKDKLNNKLNKNIDSYKNDLGGLNSRKQQLLQKMAYSDYLSSINPDKWPVNTITGNKPAIPNIEPGSIAGISMSDTSGIIGGYIHKSDTLKNNSTYSRADSIKQQAMLYKHKADSVSKMYNTYKNNYALLNDSIKEVQNKISELEGFMNTSPAYGRKSPYLNKVQNFLSGVKKMDIGLCYPAYATFLANNIPVRGINFEYQKNNRFFAFTYGTTVSTLLYNSKSMDGVLQNVRNSYNYFDVNNLSAGRKILSAKFGVGEKEGNHFFVGFLIGKGYAAYASNVFPEATPVSVESNFVLEADVRRKIGKNTIIDAVIGKSSLQQEDLNMAAIQSAARELFSKFRSNAMLIKLKTSIAATKTNLTFSVRWVDPFFNSFGIGFIRSDNMRYEVKVDQPLSKLLKYTVMFRYEEDNLLKLLNYKNTFYSINNTISYKIKRGLMLRAGYTPLIRTLNGSSYHLKSKSSIITGLLTFTPKRRNVQMQFNGSYNYYLVNTDSTPVNFQNFAYYHQLTFKSGFRTGLNVSWFKNNLKDTISNNVFLGVLDLGYQFKNGSTVSVAGKSAYKVNEKLYPGFILKAAVKLSKGLFWENQVEKFIVGDLFNGYDLQSLQRFPYCYSTKLILNF